MGIEWPTPSPTTKSTSREVSIFGEGHSKEDAKMNLTAKIFGGVGILLVGSVFCYFMLVAEPSQNQPVFREIMGDRWKGWRVREDTKNGIVIVRGPVVNHEWDELIIHPVVNRSLSDQVILGYMHHDDVEKTAKPTRVLAFSKIKDRRVFVTAIVFNDLSIGGKIRGYKNAFENDSKVYPIFSNNEFEISPDSKSAVIVPPSDFMAPNIILHMPESASSDLMRVEVMSF
jgi:hypothetical protein